MHELYPLFNPFCFLPFPFFSLNTQLKKKKNKQKRKAKKNFALGSSISILLKYTFSKILNYNQANLKQLCNRGTISQVTFQDITNKNRLCMKSPTPEAQCAEDVFQMFFKCNTLFLQLTLQMIYQSQPEHDATFEKS